MTVNWNRKPLHDGVVLGSDGRKALFLKTRDTMSARTFGSSACFWHRTIRRRTNRDLTKQPVFGIERHVTTRA